MIQLIYGSAATVAFSDEDLRDLLAIARRNNSEVGVSGMLLYHEGSFLQVLEGPEEAVMMLFHKIEKDERHDNVKLLLRTEPENPSFGEWKMGFFDASGMMDDSEDGFVDFFRKGEIFKESSADRAQSVLMQFREGSWRQKVDV